MENVNWFIYPSLLAFVFWLSSSFPFSPASMSFKALSVSSFISSFLLVNCCSSFYFWSSICFSKSCLSCCFYFSCSFIISSILSLSCCSSSSFYCCNSSCSFWSYCSWSSSSLIYPRYWASLILVNSSPTFSVKSIKTFWASNFVSIFSLSTVSSCCWIRAYLSLSFILSYSVTFLWSSFKVSNSSRNS